MRRKSIIAIALIAMLLFGSSSVLSIKITSGYYWAKPGDAFKYKYRAELYMNKSKNPTAMRGAGYTRAYSVATGKLKSVPKGYMHVRAMLYKNDELREHGDKYNSKKTYHWRTKTPRKTAKGTYFASASFRYKLNNGWSGHYDTYTAKRAIKTRSGVVDNENVDAEEIIREDKLLSEVHINSKGETYGSGLSEVVTNQYPDLIRAGKEDGTKGYVKAKDLMLDSDGYNSEEPVENVPDTVPLYDEESNKIGSIELGCELEEDFDDYPDSLAPELPVNRTKVVGVEDYKATSTENCTSLCGMSLPNNGVDAYCIKANISTGYIAFSKIKDFKSSSPTTTTKLIRDASGKAIKAPNANGLAFYKPTGASAGDFYIVTGNEVGSGPQLIGVNSAGEITKNVTAEKKISTMTLYDQNTGTFIVGVDDGDIQNYYMAKVVGDKLEIDEESHFTVEINSDHVAQDISYDKDKQELYIPTTIVDVENRTENKIWVIDMSKEADEDSDEDYNRKGYMPIKTVDGSNTTKFIVHSMDTINGEKFFCTDTVPAVDAIHRIIE